MKGNSLWNPQKKKASLNKTGDSVICQDTVSCFFGLSQKKAVALFVIL